MFLTYSKKIIKLPHNLFRNISKIYNLEKISKNTCLEKCVLERRNYYLQNQ